MTKKYLLLLLIAWAVLLVLVVTSSAHADDEFEEKEEDGGDERLTKDFTPEAQADLVTELPGMKSMGKRRMFSGYIPVEGEGRGKNNRSSKNCDGN